MRRAGYFCRQVYTTPFDDDLSSARVVKRSRQMDRSGFLDQVLQKVLKTQSLLLSCNIFVLERGYLSLVNRDGLKIRSSSGSRVQIPPLACVLGVIGKVQKMPLF